MDTVIHVCSRKCICKVNIKVLKHIATQCARRYAMIALHIRGQGILNSQIWVNRREMCTQSKYVIVGRSSELPGATKSTSLNANLTRKGQMYHQPRMTQQRLHPNQVIYKLSFLFGTIISFLKNYSLSIQFPQAEESISVQTGPLRPSPTVGK